MGEAKRRAAFKSRAGHAAPIGRGLLFPQLLERLGPNELISKEIPEEDLQSALLYWDKFACPTNNLVHVAIPSEDMLMREGLLIRPKMVGVGNFNMDDVFRFAVEAQVKHFAELDNKQPGYWCLTSAPPVELSATSEFESGRSALVELTGALPLPPAGSPLENILEFRQKRTAELQHLRAALDEVYLKIAQSGDGDMAFQIAVKEIDKAISDLLKSSREWWKVIKLGDAKTLLNLVASAAAPLLGTVAQMPGTGAIIGGAGATLSIASGIKAKLKADRASPYWYAVSVRREFG